MKPLLCWIALSLLAPALAVQGQQAEMYTFCTGTSYAYLLDTAATTTSSYFARYNIGSTAYSAHMLKDSIYQSYGMGKEGGGYASVKKWAITGPNTVTNTWTYTGTNLHHDICPLPNGNVLVISSETKTGTQIQAVGGTYSGTATFEKIQEIHRTGATTGTVVWEWKLWDHLCQNTTSSEPNYVTSIAQNPQLFNIGLVTTGDFFHLNGIDYNAELDQIVFSSHMMNEVYVIDHSTTTAEAATHSGGLSGKGGDFLYRWGRPQNYGCTANGNGITLNVIHDARWVSSTNQDYPGYISIFHNGGCSGGHAAVLFLPPYDGNHGYTYTPGSVLGPNAVTPTTPSFSVSNMGGCYVLENGNLLITNPNSKFYEVNGTGTTYQQVSVGTVQSDRLKLCDVRYPTVTATATPTTVTEGGTITLGATATSITESSPTFTYSWSSTPSGYSASTQNPTATPTSAGTYSYTVTVTNNVGCTATASVNVTVNVATGFIDAADEPVTNLVLSPNPSTGIVHINDAFLAAHHDFSVQVYDITGKLIRSESTPALIDLSGFEDGIYFFYVRTEDQNTICRKISLIRPR